MASAERQGLSEARGPSGRSEGRFWEELYWLAAICLGGWILAMAVLPPRLAHHRSMLEYEERLRATVDALDRLETQYEAAIVAVDADPFYREEVYRSVLGVKRNDEDFLQEAAPRFR